MKNAMHFRCTLEKKKAATAAAAAATTRMVKMKCKINK